MSRDIYDQFRAAQEALAAQKVAEQAERFRKEQEVLLAKTEQERQALERQEQERLERESKIARAKEQMAPVRARLIEILEAIKEHTPQIQASTVKKVIFDATVDEYQRAKEFKERSYIQLAWGNIIDPPVINYGRPDLSSHDLLGRVSDFLRGAPALPPDISTYVRAEDFRLVTVSADPMTITVYPSEGTEGRVATDAFLSYNSSLMPLLAVALSNPIRRYLSYTHGRNYFYRDGHVRWDDSDFGFTDERGVRWDISSVGRVGVRTFENYPIHLGNSGDYGPDE
ncbi:MAG: hypothetical protein HY426_04885 [Candidatus Levybacteria bacterium]|nr:hypothetical protein [Candidatus Levybacteria bacterium]